MKKNVKILSAFIISMIALASLYAKNYQFADGFSIHVSNGGGKNSCIKDFAAKELQYHLNLIFGKELKINKGTDIAKLDKIRGLYFLVGYKPADAGETAPHKSYYAIRGNKVYFWGDDKGNRKNLFHRWTRRGSMNAVYNFLERIMGIKWVYPGAQGIVFTPANQVELPEKLNFSWEMPFNMCQVRVYTWRNRRLQPLNKFVPEALRQLPEYVDKRSAEGTLWTARMRTGMKAHISYGHAFAHWWKKYGKEHPEYFGLSPYGKRGVSKRFEKRAKLCVSNPAVANQVIAEWKAKGKPKYLNICPNDGTPGFCFCKNCMKLDTRKKGESFYDHLTDRYLYFWNQLAARAVKERPDVMLVTYVYSYYRHAPRRERVEYPDNMILGLVPRLVEDTGSIFQAWADVGAKHFFLRPNDLYYGLPLYRGLEKRMYDKFQNANSFDLFGVDYDGLCGMRSLDFAYYVNMRMVTHPKKTFNELEDEYANAYGGAAEAVKKFYAFYREKNKKLLETVRKTLKDKKLVLRDSGQIIGLMAGEVEKYMGNQFDEAAEILKKARNAKMSPAEKQRFEELVLNNQHAKLTYIMLREANKKMANKPNMVDTAGRKLLAFRIKHKDVLHYPWGYLFGRFEKRYWQQIIWYRKEVLKSYENAEDKNLIFFNSFDLPAMDGWRKRNNFDKITNMTASFDRFSIKLKTGEKENLGISLHNVKVEPGAKYKIAFDSKLDQGASYVRLRCVGKKSLFSIYNKDSQSGLWRTVEKDFTVPADITSLTFYINSGTGKSNNFVYVDKVVLRKVK